MRKRTPLILLALLVAVVFAMLPGTAAAALVDAGEDGPADGSYTTVPIALGIGFLLLPISVLSKVAIAMSLTFGGVILIILLRSRSALSKD
jgi:hypothetical protein